MYHDLEPVLPETANLKVCLWRVDENLSYHVAKNFQMDDYLC